MINEKRKGDSSINTPFTLMSLSQLSDEDSYFKESSAAMNDLLKNTNVENSVLMNFDRSFFLGATFESLKNSRFTQAEVETLLPYIFGALNIELVSIYSQAYFG